MAEAERVRMPRARDREGTREELPLVLTVTRQRGFAGSAAAAVGLTWRTHGQATVY
jgi:hypothetical protein